jgi:hypothetical protein
MSLTLTSGSLARCRTKVGLILSVATVVVMTTLFGLPVRAQQSADDDLLKTLRDNGAITQEQYEALKKKYETKQAPEQPAETSKEAPGTEAKPAGGKEIEAPATAEETKPSGGKEAEASKTAEEAKPSGDKEESGGVKLKVGGFIEGALIYRSRNEVADVGSTYNGSPNAQATFPYPSNPNYKIPEFRGSARQSRLSLLASGDPNANTALAAYFELDFLGSGTTSNSVESNSYVPRLRQAYATYARSDWGMYFLFGQSWSLLTMDKVDMMPRQENIPLTIDAQYTVGFNWDRNMQLRAVKEWKNGFSLGLSLESPQAIIVADATPGTNCGPSLCYSNPGGSLLNSGAQYTTDYAPDVILKGTLDPGYGHYELYGLLRFYQDSVNGTNHTTDGGGVGGSAILPLVAGKKLEFQASFLWGDGIGRYGSAQLADATILPNGQIQPLPGLDWLLGLVARPSEKWDLYLYGGQERVNEASYAPNFGYGNPTVDTRDCFAGGVYTSCKADTSNVWQVQLGAWFKFYQGKAGMMEVGASYSYLHKTAFAGNAGALSTNDNIAMLSFRYYPLQPAPAPYLKP